MAPRRMQAAARGALLVAALALLSAADALSMKASGAPFAATGATAAIGPAHRLGPHAVSRRSLCAVLAPAAALLVREVEPALADGVPRVTKKVRLQVAIGNDEPQDLVVGLFGEAAPASASLFAALCAGTVPGIPGLTYKGSVAPRVEKNRAIVLGRLSAGSAQTIERSIDNTGYVRSTLINRAEQFANADGNQLSHDRAGLVSMRRGGGEFEFVITPAANPALDKDRIVIGEVLQGLDVVAALNQVSQSSRPCPPLPALPRPCRYPLFPARPASLASGQGKRTGSLACIAGARQAALKRQRGWGAHLRLGGV